MGDRKINVARTQMDTDSWTTYSSRRYRSVVPPEEDTTDDNMKSDSSFEECQSSISLYSEDSAASSDIHATHVFDPVHFVVTYAGKICSTLDNDAVRR